MMSWSRMSLSLLPQLLLLIAAIISFQTLQSLTAPSSTASSSGSSSTQTNAASEKMSAFYSLTANTVARKPFEFQELKNKVVLIVNVASACGFTPQYKGLQALYDKFKDRGFVILGFPCNQFGAQEKGSEEEIQSFCSLNFGVSFPIMQKIDVNGDQAHPVYQFLKKQRTSLGMEMIKWNFEKFLVNREGEVVSRYTSLATPESLEKDIEKLL